MRNRRNQHALCVHVMCRCRGELGRNTVLYAEDSSHSLSLGSLLSYSALYKTYPTLLYKAFGSVNMAKQIRHIHTHYTAHVMIASSCMTSPSQSQPSRQFYQHNIDVAKYLFYMVINNNLHILIVCATLQHIIWNSCVFIKFQ